MQGTKRITGYYIPWIFKISLLLPEIQCEIFQEYIMQYKKFTQCTVLSRPKIEHITREYRIILPKSKLVQKKKKKTNITFLKSNIIHSTNFPFDRREMFHFPSYSSCTESKVATIKIQGNKSLNGGFWEAVDITNTKKKMVKQREKRKRGAK